MTANIASFAGGSTADFRLWAQELRSARIERAAQPARIRLFDGNWVERGEVIERLDGSSMTLSLNDTESIQVNLPIDLHDRRGTYLAHWALDQEARGTSNIHVIVEKDGARIGGRTDPDRGVVLKTGPDGDRVELTFLGDIQELKHVHMAASPFLPLNLIQEPKEQLLFCPVDWGGLATLGMNMLRNQGVNFDLTKDFGDPANWGPGLWAQAQIVPMPRKLSDAIAGLSTIITGDIKQSWWDVMAPRLEDAEMMIVTRRYLAGDPEPWPGAGTGWRQGTLFVDIVDKSGYRSGTSLGGNLATGLARTIANVTSNYVEDSYDLLTGDPVDTTGYRLPGILGTQPEHPYALYIDSDHSGIESFELARGAGGPCRITAGGQSMPGVNELIEAVVGYAGDVLGDNINIGGYGIGSLGGILNAFLLPILKDSVLANMSVPLIGRAAQQGWGHWIETACTNATQAYTPAAIMDLRRRRRETDPRTAYTFTVSNAMPWLIGDRGQGHWFLGDRVPATNRYLGARVFVQRCNELTLDLTGAEDWQAKFGDRRATQDAMEKLIDTAARAFAATNQIGLT